MHKQTSETKFVSSVRSGSSAAPRAFANARRFRFKSHSVPIWTIFIGFLAVLFCGIGLFMEAWQKHNPGSSRSFFHELSSLVYETSQVLLLNMSPRNDNVLEAIGQTLAVIFAALLGYQVIVKLFAESINNSSVSLVRAHGNHVIICGLGDTGAQLLRDLVEDHEVIVIEQDESCLNLRLAKDLGAAHVIGDATDPETLAIAGVERAAELYLTAGSDDLNLKACLNAMAAIQSKTRPEYLGKLACYIHLSHQALANSIGDLADSALSHATPIELRTFSVVDNAARLLVQDQLTTNRPSTEEAALYAIIGFGPLAQSIVLHLAQLAHFENYLRPRMLILAHDCAPTAATFLRKRPGFAPADCIAAQWTDVRFDSKDDNWAAGDGPTSKDGVQAIEYVVNARFAPFDDDFSSPAFVGKLAELLEGDSSRRVKSAVVLALDDEHANLGHALALRERLNMYLREKDSVPIYAYAKQESLHRVLETFECKIFAFGASAEVASLEAVRDVAGKALAKAVQASYVKVTRGAGGAGTELPQNRIYRESNRRAAEHAVIKKKIFDKLTSDEEAKHEALARMEHNRYVAERLLAGWRRSDDSPSPETRPHLCTWENLMNDPSLAKECDKDLAQVKEIMEAMTAEEPAVSVGEGAAQAIGAAYPPMRYKSAPARLCRLATQRYRLMNVWRRRVRPSRDVGSTAVAVYQENPNA